MSAHILFSEVSGKVQIHGKELAGLKVKRWYRGGYADTEATDIAITDNSGNFTFPLIKSSSLMENIIPHEPVITQKISVQQADVEIIIYATVKRNYENNGEYGGRPLKFTFDPTAKPTFIGPSPTIRVTLAEH